MLLSSKEMLGDHFHLVSFLGTAFLYLLLPAVPLGILFPLVSDASIRKSTDEGHTVGSLNVAELTGAVVGSILIGFILIPWMGLARSFWAISLIAMIGYYQHSPGSRRISHFSYAVVLVALFLHQFNTDRAAGIDAPVRVSKEYIVFLEPSPFGNVAVTRKPRHDAGFKKELYISQREMCDSEAWDSERDLARLAMFDWREDDLHVLNIGLGCGFTAQEVLRSNKGAYLDIVEINPVVARATASYFSEENGNILENPRVHLVLRDGIEHLQEGGKKYSRILIDIEEPTIIHSSAFYTKEGFGLVKNRLKEGGIFGLWSVDQKETSKIIWNTLKSVFREVKVFPIAGQVVFLASDNPLVVPPSAQTDRVQSILRTPTMEIATIGKNPYPKYFNINDLFGLPPDKLDPFEIK